MANLSELVTVRDFLESHPDLHEQTSFSCGTTGCVAGWTVALRLGAKAGVYLDQYLEVYLDQYLEADSIDDYTAIARQAKDILELTREEASALFYLTTSNKDAMDLLNVLIDREKGGYYDKSLLDAQMEYVETNSFYPGLFEEC